MRQRIANWLLRHLLNAIVIEDVLKIERGQFIIGGQAMQENERAALREEARFVSKTRLWQIMQETLKATAQEKMFEKSVDFDDMKFGKTMLYNLDIQQKLIDILRK